MAGTAALDDLIAVRFGGGWRVQPWLADERNRPATTAEFFADDIVDEDTAWNLLHDSFGDLLGEALGADVPLGDLVAAAAAAIAPGECRPEVVAAAALPLSAGMVEAETAPGLAAIDGVLGIVLSGHPAVAEADLDPHIEPGPAASRWFTAVRMGDAIVARQLAAAGQRLKRQFGPGIFGYMPRAAEDTHTSLRPAEMRDTYRSLAGDYVRWQQQGSCQCQYPPGRCTKPPHVLRCWEPGPKRGDDKDSRRAPHLAAWLRSWILGAQFADTWRSKGEAVPLKAKAFEAGLFYRHVLRHVTTATVQITIAEVLREHCDTAGCPKFGEYAKRLTALELAVETKARELRSDSGTGPLRTRVCQSVPTHDLDFTAKARFRDYVLVDVWAAPGRSSHARYDNLTWNEDLGRWTFVTKQGGRKGLPLPPEHGWDRLCSRGAAQAEGWRPPELPWAVEQPYPELDWEAESDGECLLPARTKEALDRLFQSGAEDFPSQIRDVLVDAGLIPMDPSCRCCGADPDRGHCEIRFDRLINDYLTLRGEGG